MHPKNLAALLLLVWVNTALNAQNSVTVVDSFDVNGKKAYVFDDLSWEYVTEKDSTPTFINSVNGYKAGLWSVPDQTRLFFVGWFNNVTHSLNPKLPYSQIPLKFCLLFSQHNKVFLPHAGGMSSPYGLRWGKNHNGVDIVLRTGEEVFSVFDGKVRYAKYNHGGYGNLVIVRHYNGLETYYAHLESINVRENDVIKAGDVIGRGGTTGHSSGPHLHFEIRILDFPINPELIFDFVNRKIKVDGYVIQNGISFMTDADLMKYFPIKTKADSTFQTETKPKSRREKVFGNM